jgi:hypothetical protein
MKGADLRGSISASRNFQRGQVIRDEKLDQEKRDQQMEDGFFHGTRPKRVKRKKRALIQYRIHNKAYFPHNVKLFPRRRFRYGALTPGWIQNSRKALSPRVMPASAPQNANGRNPSLSLSFVPLQPPVRPACRCGFPGGSRYPVRRRTSVRSGPGWEARPISVPRRIGEVDGFFTGSAEKSRRTGRNAFPEIPCSGAKEILFLRSIPGYSKISGKHFRVLYRPGETNEEDSFSRNVRQMFAKKVLSRANPLWGNSLPSPQTIHHRGTEDTEKDIF